jgi:hypothetical protein
LQTHAGRRNVDVALRVGGDEMAADNAGRPTRWLPALSLTFIDLAQWYCDTASQAANPPDTFSVDAS